VHCNMINSKSSAFNKLETCIGNVLCQLYVKYYILNVFVFERNFSIKLSNTTHPQKDVYMKVFLCLYVKNSSLNLSRHFRYTHIKKKQCDIFCMYVAFYNIKYIKKIKMTTM